MTQGNPFEPPKAALDTVDPDGDAPALWNPDAAGAWSIFLTPVFGSVLLWRNWQAIGDAKKARAGMIWILVSILMYVATWLLYFALGLVYLVVWYLAWQRPQALYVREYLGSDYPRKPWFFPVFCGFILLMVGTFACIIALMIFFKVGRGFR